MASTSDLALTIGEIERKVDMSLDDIIKQSKGMHMKRHIKVKDWNKTRIMQPVQGTQVQQAQVQQRVQQPYRRESLQRRELQQERVPPQRKDLLQRFVSLQSSTLRQEKLKEARARHGTSMFAATKAAGLQALSGNAVGTLNRISRYLLTSTCHVKTVVLFRGAGWLLELSLDLLTGKPHKELVGQLGQQPGCLRPEVQRC